MISGGRFPTCSSLKTRIAVLVLLLFLGGIWLLTYLTTARLQADLVTLLADQQYAHVSHVAAELQRRVQRRFAALEHVAQQITPQLLADPARLRALLERQAQLPIYFEPGVVVISRDGIGLADSPPTPNRVGSSYVEVEYFPAVMATGKPVIGKPRIGRFTKKPGVAFAVPVKGADGRVEAVLAGFAPLGDHGLFGVVHSSSVGKTGWLAISDARHRMIVAINDPDRLLQPFPAPGVNRMLDRFAAGEEGSGIAVNSQGREVLTSARRIGDSGWFVQAVLPTDEAFAPLRELKQRAYTIAAGLSLAISAIIWLVVWRLLAPLSKAAADIRRMATANDADALRELPVDRQDEVGELVESFNILSRQRHELEADLERQARCDALTGLANRRQFIDIAGKELARVARHGGALSVLMLDLDRFKTINDTYGHLVGDQVLQRFAEICRTALREMDLAARLGGEEFAVLLPGSTLPAAVEVAERLRQAALVERMPLAQGQALQFSVSIGVASLSGQESDIDTLLNHADHALYEAKAQGRNRVCAWDERSAESATS